MRKLNKHYAEAIERIKNGTTFSKQDVRNHHKKKSKLKQHQEAIGSLFNNELNYIINNKFVFTTNRDADPLIIIGPQLNLMAGGFVDCGSYRHLDMVDCLLTRNEFVVSAPAVRGLGKGSYQLGCQILQLLMAHWIKQGKAYAHKR